MECESQIQIKSLLHYLLNHLSLLKIKLVFFLSFFWGGEGGGDIFDVFNFIDLVEGLIDKHMETINYTQISKQKVIYKKFVRK